MVQSQCSLLAWVQTPETQCPSGFGSDSVSFILDGFREREMWPEAPPTMYGLEGLEGKKNCKETQKYCEIMQK